MNLDIENFLKINIDEINDSDLCLKLHIITELYYSSLIKLSDESQERTTLIREGYSRVSQISNKRYSLLKERQSIIEIKIKNRFRDYFSFYKRFNSLINIFITKYYIKYDSMIELGPGSGRFLINFLQDKIIEKITYVEPDESFNNNISELLNKKNISFKSYRSVEEAFIPENSFDFIVCTDVWEHLLSEDKIIILNWLRSALKCKKITVVIQTPNRLVGPHDVSEYVLLKFSNSIGFHIVEYSQEMLYEEFRSVGFTKFKSPLFYFSFYGYIPIFVDIKHKIYIEKLVNYVCSYRLKKFLVKFFALDIIFMM